MRNTHFMTWNKATNTEKCEMHTVGPVIWREKLKITENEKYTLYDVIYGEEK